MVRQYPYQLWAFVTDEPAQNDNGDFQKPTSDWQNVAKCRDEANTQVRTVVLTDSSESGFDTVIYLPKSTAKLAEGTPIEVRDGTTVRLAATVKRFTKEQLHCRLWA